MYCRSFCPRVLDDSFFVRPTPVLTFLLGLVFSTGVWLGGDMHLHSNHSDDAKDNYMDKIVAKALERGLDFFVVTDHDNHVDGELTTWDDPLYYDHNMTVFYGVEWTSGDGTLVSVCRGRRFMCDFRHENNTDSDNFYTSSKMPFLKLWQSKNELHANSVRTPS